MSATKLDWDFLARNLARHLISTDDVETMERIIEDGERDARALDAPSDFWMRVAEQYRSEERRLGLAERDALDELRQRQPDRPIFASDFCRRLPR